MISASHMTEQEKMAGSPTNAPAAAAAAQAASSASSSSASASGTTTSFVDFSVGKTFMQGRRPKQEDRHAVVEDLRKTAKAMKQPNPNGLDDFDDILPKGPCSFFAVFDGHQGSRCAEFCCKKVIVKMPGFLGKVCEAVKEREGKEGGKDSEGHTNSTSQREDIFAEEIRKATTQLYLDIDDEFLKKFKTMPDGCTAVISILLGDTLYTSWLGDSRAVWMTAEGKCEEVSRDHKPEDPLEEERVKKAGGKVIRMGGCARVAAMDFEEKAKAAQEANNTIPHPVALAVARSLGDRHFKIPNALLSAEPDMDVRKVTHGSGLMLSCDGVFDVMRNEEVIATVKKFRTAPREACGSIVDIAYKRKSTDNLTCIVVYFYLSTTSQESCKQKREMMEKMSGHHDPNKKIEVGKDGKKLPYFMTDKPPDNYVVMPRREAWQLDLTKKAEEAEAKEREGKEGEKKEGEGASSSNLAIKRPREGADEGTLLPKRTKYDE